MEWLDGISTLVREFPVRRAWIFAATRAASIAKGIPEKRDHLAWIEGRLVNDL